MGHDKNLEPLAPPPVYYVQPSESDEIDLVDLWITLSRHKKSFLTSALLLMAIGVLFVTLFYQEKYLLRSIIEIESVRIYDRPMQIDTPESIINRFEVAILPELVKSNLDNPVSGLLAATKASNPKDSKLVVIENKVPLSQQEIFTGFHDQLISEIFSDLDRKVSFAKNKLRTEIALNNNKIEEIRVNTKILDQELEERSSIIRQTSESPELLLRSLENEIAFKKQVIEKEIELLSSRVNQLLYELKHSGPRVLKRGSLAIKPSGLSRIGAYLLVIVGSLFLAFFVTVGVIFLQKVKQRRASEG